MRYSVIAIEREYASGGSEIGEKLGQKLGIPCFGQEILEKAAAKLNLPPDAVVHAEENMTGSLLYSLAAFVSAQANADSAPLEQRLAVTESEIIKNLSMSPCVLVGRGAAALTKDRGSALRVFIHADYNTRIERAVKVYGDDPRQAESILRRFDKRRATFFKATTDLEWKDPDLYHMFLNSGKLGLDRTVDILCKAVL